MDFIEIVVWVEIRVILKKEKSSLNFLKRNTKIFELVFEFEFLFKVKLAQMFFGRLRTPLMNQHIKKTQIVRIKHTYVGMTFLDMMRLIKFLERRGRVQKCSTIFGELFN